MLGDESGGSSISHPILAPITTIKSSANLIGLIKPPPTASSHLLPPPNRVENLAGIDRNELRFLPQVSIGISGPERNRNGKGEGGKGGGGGRRWSRNQSRDGAINRDTTSWTASAIPAPSTDTKRLLRRSKLQIAVQFQSNPNKIPIIIIIIIILVISVNL